MVAPLKPKDMQALSARGTEAEVDEYERLLSKRFTTDPSIPLTLAQRSAKTRDERRLDALAAKLFPSAGGSASRPRPR